MGGIFPPTPPIWGGEATSDFESTRDLKRGRLCVFVFVLKAIYVKYSCGTSKRKGIFLLAALISLGSVLQLPRSQIGTDELLWSGGRAGIGRKTVLFRNVCVRQGRGCSHCLCIVLGDPRAGNPLILSKRPNGRTGNSSQLPLAQ